MDKKQKRLARKMKKPRKILKGGMRHSRMLEWNLAVETKNERKRRLLGK